MSAFGTPDGVDERCSRAVPACDESYGSSTAGIGTVSFKLPTHIRHTSMGGLGTAKLAPRHRIAAMALLASLVALAAFDCASARAVWPRRGAGVGRAPFLGSADKLRRQLLQTVQVNT